MTIRRTLISLSLILLLTSCLSRVESKGYSFDLNDYEVKKGLSSKDVISHNMGSPTLVSYIDDEMFWIYFEEEVRELLFLKPKVLKRKILVISFDKNNIVKDLEEYNLDSENKIIFSDQKTKIKESKKNFLFDLFSNIGQVAPQ